MPKLKDGSNRIYSYVAEVGEHIFASDGGVLFCKMCEIKPLIVKLKNSSTQSFITTPSSRKSDFNKDLCKALLKSNIPLEKLSNTHYRSFLEKYVDKDISSVSTLRKTYVDDCYHETMDEIRDEVQSKKIWVSIDETTDSGGRYVANVIIGTLPIDEPGIQHDNVILFVTDAAPYMVKAAKSIQALYSKMIHVTCLVLGLH
ncbi:DUF659 domain-containing protein [Aphis craccivora]|uniref:DUF659 domain-containing protein n=1 Tax=Aphis craccivora TaxID=307492 RepID=A0A6G0Y4X4_APHCR|nr:DUF659 domain-containing protein [Aphis craccivora]